MADVKQRCLICRITRQQVQYVRNREGYTLGCGIESNTEAGFDYEELSPRHRWKAWSDNDLARVGIKSEAFEKYRNEIAQGLHYADCDDRERGHNFAANDVAPDWGIKPGQCWDCGRMRGAE